MVNQPPGRPPLYSGERLSDRVVVQLTPRQWQTLERQARHTGQSLCAFIRGALLDTGQSSPR